MLACLLMLILGAYYNTPDNCRKFQEYVFAMLWGYLSTHRKLMCNLGHIQNSLATLEQRHKGEEGSKKASRKA